jgi:hypothetical protein
MMCTFRKKKKTYANKCCLNLLKMCALIVPIVGVEYCHLFLAGLDNMWMSMTHVTDVVDTIKIRVPHVIIHELTWLLERINNNNAVV